MTRSPFAAVLIERVARALSGYSEATWETLSADGRTNYAPEVLGRTVGSDVHYKGKLDYLHDANIAIRETLAGMMEPSEGMVEAADALVKDKYAGWNLDDAMEGAGINYSMIFKAMLAALSKEIGS